MVPSAGLEPAWVAPYAPQTYVSTNSTTTARALLFLRGHSGSGPRRSGRGRLCGGRGRGRRLGLPAGLPRLGQDSLSIHLLRDRLDDRGLRPGLNESQYERQQDKPDEGPRCQLVKQRRRAPRAESGLRASTAEGSGDVRAFPLLDQDDQDEEEAYEDVKHDQGDVSDFHWASKKGEEVYAAGTEASRERARVSSRVRGLRILTRFLRPETLFSSVLFDPGDGRESAGFQAGSSDQETIHAGRLQKLPGIFGGNRASVEDADAPTRGKQLRQMHSRRSGILGRGRLARA